MGFRVQCSIYKWLEVSSMNMLRMDLTWFTQIISCSIVQSDAPIASMYGIFTYIYHQNYPNVGKYTIHGWYGVCQNITVRIRAVWIFFSPRSGLSKLRGCSWTSRDFLMRKIHPKRCSYLLGIRFFFENLQPKTVHCICVMIPELLTGLDVDESELKL